MGAIEVWKPVVGCEGRYEISTSGRVASLPRKGRLRRRTLKQLLDPHGRPRVCLYLRGKCTQHLVSHLVAAAFLPQKSSTDQVLRHLNDNPTDNRVENLAWGTYSDNLNDAIRNGRSHPKGESHCRAKLTEDNVREIRRLYATGEFTLKELAMRFGVHFSGIAKIVTRSTWKHVV